MKLENEVKNILIQESLIGSPIGSFFSSLGYVLNVEYDENKKYFFVVNDYLLDLNLDIERVKFEVDCGFENSAHFRFQGDSSIFSNSDAEAIVSKFFKYDLNFDFLSSLVNETPSLINLKISDYLNIGYFIDAIVIDAYKKNHDIISVRNFLNRFFDVAFHELNEMVESDPIDLNYCSDDQVFNLDFTFNCSSFDKLKDEFFDKELPYFVNIFDLVYLETRSQVKMKVSFFSNPELKKVKMYSTKNFQKIKNKHIELPDLEYQSGLVDHPFENFDQFENPGFLDRVILNGKEVEMIYSFIKDNEDEEDLMYISSFKDELDQKILELKNSNLDLKLLDLKEILNLLNAKHDVDTNPDRLFNRLCQAIKKSKEKNDSDSQDANRQSYNENQRLKLSLQKSIGIIKNKDALINKLKKDLENQVKHSNVKVDFLEKKLKEIKIDNLDMNQALTQLSEEKETLISGGQLSSGESSFDKEEMQQLLKAQLDQIQGLQDGIKQIDEKHKEAALEVKKLEQKLKFSNSQMDVLLKKKNIAPKGVQKDSSDVSRELDKLRATFKRLEQDYAEKKTESFRLKQENLILMTKLADVEKKLSYAEKKVA